MATCPSGHDSADPDFCDVCGMRIGGTAGPPPVAAPPPTTAAPAPAAGTPSRQDAQANAGTPPGADTPADAGVTAEPCPRCGTARTGQFCEVCGYDFASAQAPAAASASAPAGPGAGQTDSAAPPATQDAAGQRQPGLAPAAQESAGQSAQAPSAQAPAGQAPAGQAPAGAGAGAGDGAPGPAAGDGAPAAGTADGGAPGGPATVWTAVVTADRAYFDSVIAAGGPDAASIEFPGYCPERRFRLSGREMRIGRRSVSRGLEPEIDLTGPPADPGVSHMHAVLTAEPDGTWSVLDPGSSNGTMVNGSEIAPGVRVPLRDGDRISVGAWTVLTIRAAAGR